MSPRVIGVLAALSLSAIIFSLGVYIGRRRPRVEIQERVVTRVVEVSVGTVKKTGDVRKDITRTKTQTKKADGTVTTVTETKVAERAQTDEQTSTKKTTTAQTDVARSEVRMAPEPASWRVSLLAGASLKPFPPNALVYGLSVERRILGPVWVGAWGLSSGVAGVSVGLTF